MQMQSRIITSELKLKAQEFEINYEKNLINCCSIIPIECTFCLSKFVDADSFERTSNSSSTLLHRIYMLGTFSLSPYANTFSNAIEKKIKVLHENYILTRQHQYHLDSRSRAKSACLRIALLTGRLTYCGRNNP